MAWFFSEDEISGGRYIVEGENFKHLKVLRTRVGEELTVVTPKGIRHDCVVTQIDSSSAVASVQSSAVCENEPDVFVTLYQALPKGDKMDYIVQKCVELGVGRIVPMLTARCVSRPDAKSLEKKRARWQKIALGAAMQSRRGIVPEVSPCVSFAEAAQLTRQNEQTVFFYEMGGESVKKILTHTPKSIGIFIGSEGGFEKAEVEEVCRSGGKAATLGKRILRAETAPLAALSIIMYQTDNF